MTESEAFALMIEHLESLFPKACPGCHRHFATYREFARVTETIGQPTALDLETGNLNSSYPSSAISVCRCPCGAQLTLTSQGMPAVRLWSLFAWGQAECARRGMKSNEFLDFLRREIRQRVLTAER
jgi:hypothetical protein